MDYKKLSLKIFDSRKILKIHNFFIEEKILKDWATLNVGIKDGRKRQDTHNAQ